MGSRRKKIKPKKKKTPFRRLSAKVVTEALSSVVLELNKGDQVLVLDSKLAHITPGDKGIVDGRGPDGKGWWVTFHKNYPSALPHGRSVEEDRTFWFEDHELQRCNS
jgi:hypothetical protein